MTISQMSSLMKVLDHFIVDKVFPISIETEKDGTCAIWIRKLPDYIIVECYKNGDVSLLYDDPNVPPHESLGNIDIQSDSDYTELLVDKIYLLLSTSSADQAVAKWMSWPYLITMVPIPAEQGGGYLASIPLLGDLGYTGTGPTPTEAIEDLRSCQRCNFTDLYEAGQAPPQPEPWKE